jgi:DTW domain-containing protein YfiP
LAPGLWRSLTQRSLKLTRNRNIKDPCPICAASRTLCLCDLIPRIELGTRICLVVHHRELRRSSNTGLLALRALVNSEMRIRGETKDTLDLSDLVTSRYRTFLFYPSDNAVELDKELVAQDPRPIQLIVPDGTWRAQHKPGRMATLQAIAQGLGVIEGDLVEAQLIKLYHAKVERTLIGRGLLRAK